MKNNIGKGVEKIKLILSETVSTLILFLQNKNQRIKPPINQNAGNKNKYFTEALSL